MKLKRHRQPPEMDPAFAEVIVALYYAFEDNLERCARLTLLREDPPTQESCEEALTGARRIAYVCRMTFEALGQFPLESIPDGVMPIGVLGAVARLTYAFVGLAEEEPEPEALLTPAELDGLIDQYEIGDWVATMREMNPELDTKGS